MYSIKMRASKNDIHISGCERIVKKIDLEKITKSLLLRGLNHSRGEADFLNIKVEKINIDEILFLKPLKVRVCEVDSVSSGYLKIREILKTIGDFDADEVLNLLKNTSDMKGAILLDIYTFKRLEDTGGIRVSYMDYVDTDFSDEKNHFREALCLSTKAMAAKAIVGEVCISDDPDYITGYVSTKDEYIRITKLKELGDNRGVRIFLFDSKRDSLENTIDFLKNKKVLIDG